jgi:hypothetical protein
VKRTRSPRGRSLGSAARNVLRKSAHVFPDPSKPPVVSYPPALAALVDALTQVVAPINSTGKDSKEGCLNQSVN